MVGTTTAVPSRVFPLPGWSGPIQAHWGNPQAIGGSDLMIKPGTTQPIVNITTGKVVFTTTQAQAPNSGGNSIEIQGTDGLFYYYAHMRDAPTYKVGDTVKTGAQIGIVDSTGDASPSAPHLHIGIGHSIQSGVGAFGGLGTGYNALGLLQDLQTRANIPALGTPDGQAAVAAGNPAGTVSINTPSPPAATDPLSSKIVYLAQLLSQAGVDATKIPTMVAISLAENHSSNPTAISSTGDYGLWQINWGTWGDALCRDLQICSLTQLMDPANNARAAGYVQTHGVHGYGEWTTYQQGLQNQYQPQVDSALTGVDLSGSGSVSTGTSDSSGNPVCPNWTLLDTTIAGSHIKIEIPDLGCVLLTSLQQLITQITSAFTLEVWTLTYDWGFNVFFGLTGLILIAIGIGGLVGMDRITGVESA